VFDVDELLTELVASREDPDPRGAAHEVLARALASPGDVAEALAPAAGGFELLHHAPDLTVLNIAWAPHMRLMPHDHRMWAVIGIYGGAETNIFYRAEAGAPVEANRRTVAAGEALLLGEDVVHAVENTLEVPTRGLHVYGGDLLAAPRSMWDPATGRQAAYDIPQFMQWGRELAEQRKAAAAP